MPDKRRRRLVADRKLQGALLAHTTLYWFHSLFSVALIAVCWIVFVQRPSPSTDLLGQLMSNCGPLLIGALLILPLVLLDCLRLSNRFAGPMLRFQRAMRELAAGQPTDEITLRRGDYWSEFAEDVNHVARLLQAQRADESPAPGAASDLTADDEAALPESAGETNAQADFQADVEAEAEAGALLAAEPEGELAAVGVSSASDPVSTLLDEASDSESRSAGKPKSTDIYGI